MGRLDKDSSGLLILTNDGWLTGALIHSEGQIEKEYLVETEMALSDEQLYKVALLFCMDSSSILLLAALRWQRA